ncbi:MAG TPA: STAS domain-containing protein [Jiangellaceae bacterium]
MTLLLQRASNSEPQFSVKATGSGALAVVGELDMSTAPALRASLARVIAEPALETTIVVDLSGVTFTDIVGLDPLLEARRQLVKQGRHLILADSPPCVTRLLRLLATRTPSQRSLQRRETATRRRSTTQETVAP